MIQAPKDIQVIGEEVALSWPDGREDFLRCDFLRKHSPSAENIGETDIMGVTHGGTLQTDFTGVMVRGWELVGNYGIRFEFSDSHNTGIFTFKYLKELADR